MMSQDKLTLSALPKTWILDLDGTLVMHNGYLGPDGCDELLPGACEFLNGIGDDDMVIIVTSRTEELREATESFLSANGIRYDAIIWGAPYGERILVNDRKPSGLDTAYAINCDRDCFHGVDYVVDGSL